MVDIVWLRVYWYFSSCFYLGLGYDFACVEFDKLEVRVGFMVRVGLWILFGVVWVYVEFWSGLGLWVLCCVFVVLCLLGLCCFGLLLLCVVWVLLWCAPGSYV